MDKNKYNKCKYQDSLFAKYNDWQDQCHKDIMYSQIIPKNTYSPKKNTKK